MKYLKLTFILYFPDRKLIFKDKVSLVTNVNVCLCVFYSDKLRGEYLTSLNTQLRVFYSQFTANLVFKECVIHNLPFKKVLLYFIFLIISSFFLQQFGRSTSCNLKQFIYLIKWTMKRYSRWNMGIACCAEWRKN